jgi:hypothetical protein
VLLAYARRAKTAKEVRMFGWTGIAKGVAIAAIVGLALVAVPAGVGKDGDVLVKGSCTKSSTSKLKLSREDGRVEVEFEVDQNRNGVTWQIVLERNGTRVFRGARTTRPPSGSFEARRVVGDTPAADRFRGRATSPSGEVCTARASF